MMLKQDTHVFCLCTDFEFWAQLFAILFTTRRESLFLVLKLWKSWDEKKHVSKMKCSPSTFNTFKNLPFQWSFYHSFSVLLWYHRFQLMDVDAEDPIPLSHPSPRTNNNHQNEPLLFVYRINAMLFISIEYINVFSFWKLPAFRLLTFMKYYNHWVITDQNKSGQFSILNLIQHLKQNIKKHIAPLQKKSDYILV